MRAVQIKTAIGFKTMQAVKKGPPDRTETGRAIWCRYQKLKHRKKIVRQPAAIPTRRTTRQNHVPREESMSGETSKTRQSTPRQKKQRRWPVSPPNSACTALEPDSSAQYPKRQMTAAWVTVQKAARMKMKIEQIVCFSRAALKLCQHLSLVDQDNRDAAFMLQNVVYSGLQLSLIMIAQLTTGRQGSRFQNSLVGANAA